MDEPGQAPGAAERFEVLRRLGAGGAGVVFEAFDRDRGVRVALKSLRHVDPAALFRFKREFRALADVVHPNLVALQELLSIGDEWFVTMEFVEGTDFIAYVRGGSVAPGAGPATATVTRTVSLRAGSRGAEDAVERAGRRSDAPPPPLDAARLRAALAQLVRAAARVHESGWLHRDLKPSNVLVTAAGRVVVCDFGLVAGFGASGPLQGASLPQQIVGTVAYMSPEQAACAELTPASDLYSVGVMLYEALTGRLPFTGSSHEVLREKLLGEPLSPALLAPDAPDDLLDLAVDLLRRSPEQRPTAAEVLARLGEAPDGGTAIETASVRQRARLFGRTAELGRLRDAFREVLGGSPTTVLVHGPSGIGKTALLERFVEEVALESNVLVLGGRCYERESVPYKALDSLVDALSSHLVTQPYEHAATLLPASAAALARLFPTLRRIDAMEPFLVRGVDALDPQELRRRAFTAFRQLVRRIADDVPTVLWIDDLQWGDADGAQLLLECLRSPGAPVVLLVACYRTDDAERSPFLQAFVPAQRATGRAHEIELGPLPAADGAALARALLAERARSGDEASAVAAESGGSPFFVETLVRHLATHPDETRPVGELRVDDVVRAQLRSLPQEARALLLPVVVSGRPLPLVVARGAAGLAVEQGQRGLAALRGDHLVRTRGVRENDPVDCYHDRIRQILVADLDDEQLRAQHACLARALEASRPDEIESLAEHWLNAGEPGRAAGYAERAADQAVAALAFDRAASLYRRALALGTHEPEPRRSLLERLGDTLASAGRGAEAATAYRAASELSASADQRLELRRRAAEQLLLSGHVAEGTEALRRVLDAVGLDFPKTPARALASLLYRRARVRLRGMRFRERPAEAVPARTLARLDACLSAAKGLTLIDPIRGYDFQARLLLGALDAGEPLRIARALALETGLLAGGGSATWARTQAVAARAHELAERTGDPRTIALAATTEAAAACLRGSWREARALAEQAETVLRVRCTGVAWELAAAQFFAVVSTTAMGELRELERRIAVLAPEAIERGDVLTATSLRLYQNVVWLARDDPERARREVEAAVRAWPAGEFHVVHFYRLYAECQTDLYEGRYASAWERAERSWPALERSQLLRVQNLRIEGRFMRARCALAAARESPARAAALLRVARRDARALAAEGVGWGSAIATLLRAQAGHLAGDRARTSSGLADAEAQLVAADMALYAAMVATARAALSAATEGTPTTPHPWLVEQGVVVPERLSAMLVPAVL